MYLINNILFGIVDAALGDCPQIILIFLINHIYNFLILQYFIELIPIPL